MYFDVIILVLIGVNFAGIRREKIWNWPDCFRFIKYVQSCL